MDLKANDIPVHEMIKITYIDVWLQNNNNNQAHHALSNEQKKQERNCQVSNNKHNDAVKFILNTENTFLAVHESLIIKENMLYN